MPLTQRDASVLRRFEGFCAREGLRVALDDDGVVEAFLTISCSGLRPHTLGTYRSTLRRLGPTRGAGEYCASPAPPPYDSAEVAALWSIVRHQKSELRVTNATVLLCATIGAGLRARELAHLLAGDVTHARGRTSVAVRGCYPRLVPVLVPFADALFDVAQRRRGYVFRPGARVRDTKNLVGEICAQLVRDPDDVRLTSPRARATFLCQRLAMGTPLRELCALAGVREVESLLRYARHVPGAPSTKAALRARARAESQ